MSLPAAVSPRYSDITTGMDADIQAINAKRTEKLSPSTSEVAMTENLEGMLNLYLTGRPVRLNLICAEHALCRKFKVV
jgi:hypothetical protein